MKQNHTEQYGKLKQEFDLFCHALTFLSRLPAPAYYRFQPEHQGASSKYFSIVGIALAALQLVILYLLLLALPPALALLMMIAASFLMTGGFHEDGLADMADGFGGGWEQAQILNIMKDSRLGSYGTLTLISTLAIKYGCLLLLLEQLNMVSFCLMYILTQSLSRAMASSLMLYTPYIVQKESKMTAISSSIPAKSLWFLLLPCLPFVWPLGLAAASQILLGLLLFQFIFRAYLIKRIGGYTGDCLGGAQQLNELLILIIAVSTLTI